jgi:tRNA(adenine34) deaminase
MATKTRNTNRWSHKVKTVSTYPPEGIFTKDPKTIAKVMARKDVSPKGLGSAIRMVTFFINRAGKGLSAERKKALEQAKQLLRERNHKAKQKAKEK